MSIDNLVNGGLKLDIANTMSENVIGVLSLPLSVIPEFVINKKKYFFQTKISRKRKRRLSGKFFF